MLSTLLVLAIQSQEPPSATLMRRVLKSHQVEFHERTPGNFEVPGLDPRSWEQIVQLVASADPGFDYNRFRSERITSAPNTRIGAGFDFGEHLTEEKRRLWEILLIHPHGATVIADSDIYEAIRRIGALPSLPVLKAVMDLNLRGRYEHSKAARLNLLSKSIMALYKQTDRPGQTAIENLHAEYYRFTFVNTNDQQNAVHLAVRYAGPYSSKMAFPEISAFMYKIADVAGTDSARSYVKSILDIYSRRNSTGGSGG